MENQHHEIKGYRELSRDEIDAMHLVKAMERDAMVLFNHIARLTDVDQRRLALAKTSIEQAAMWAVKAIGRPGEC